MADENVHELPSGIVMTSWPDGRITLDNGDIGDRIDTTAAELLYMIQYYQEAVGSISVPIDWSQWRGMIGTPKEKE